MKFNQILYFINNHKIISELKNTILLNFNFYNKIEY
jgi:hypothetical protein